MTPPEPVRRRPALGLVQLALGRHAGLAQFGDTNEAYLASLAPLLGILLVLAALMARASPLPQAIGFFLVTLCSLLAPAVIADLFCRRWDRRGHWALYANVLNWSQWLMVFLLLTVLLPLAAILGAIGVPAVAASGALLLGLTGFVLWFHWFVARHALDVSPRHALAVMLAVVIGTAALVHLPDYVTGLVGGTSSVALPDVTIPSPVNGSGS